MACLQVPRQLRLADKEAVAIFTFESKVSLLMLSSLKRIWENDIAVRTLGIFRDKALLLNRSLSGDDGN